MDESQVCTLELFAPLLGQQFELSGAGLTGAGCPAALVQAQALPASCVQSRAPFSLVFHGPPTPALPQSIYRLTHPALQAMDLFLVPIGTHADGVRYEAVFN